MNGNIFINYRREDSGHIAGRLYDSLAPTFGRNKLFMDVDNIPVGRDFESHLKSQVAVCDAMLAIIGPHWLTAKDEAGQRRIDNPEDYVGIEIAAALARDIPVVPVLVDDARMPKPSELPDSLKLLARRQAIQVRHTSFRGDAETLVKKLRDLLKPGLSTPATIGAAAIIVLITIIGWFLLQDKPKGGIALPDFNKPPTGTYEPPPPPPGSSYANPDGTITTPTGTYEPYRHGLNLPDFNKPIRRSNQ